MKIHLTFTLTFVTLLLSFPHSYAQVFPSKKPNIILIYADDISARELPIYGSDTWSLPPKGGDSQDLAFRAKTPVLDQLAKQGCWVTTTWAATVCSPSRAMMMTGRYAHLHKWWHNSDYGKYTNEEGKKRILPLYQTSPHTLGHIAKKGGYTTYWAGKTQMKGSDLTLFGFDEGIFTPGAQGANDNPYTDFRIEEKKINGKKILINNDTGDEVKYYAQSGWYWKPHVQLMNHPSSKETFEWWPNTNESKKEYGLNTYGPDVELDYIFDFIERKHKNEEPFFVYHTSHLGHDGWDFLDPTSGAKWPGTPKVTWEDGNYSRTEPNITGDKGVYNTHGTVTESGIHTHINYLDYQVWLYQKKLKELNIDDNTIIIFCADNGTSKYGKGSPVSQKGCHVPLIIYAPGMEMTKKGKQDILVSIADILPTIADIVGVEIPDSYEINGESLIPYLTTNKQVHRPWIYAYKGDKQLVRGKKVLIDGFGKAYDVRTIPTDLIGFPMIKDWTKVSEAYVTEKEMLLEVIKPFDLHDVQHDGPIVPLNKIQALKVVK